MAKQLGQEDYDFFSKLLLRDGLEIIDSDAYNPPAGAKAYMVVTDTAVIAGLVPGAGDSSGYAIWSAIFGSPRTLTLWSPVAVAQTLTVEGLVTINDNVVVNGTVDADGYTVDGQPLATGGFDEALAWLAL